MNWKFQITGLSGNYRITDAELAKDKKVRCVSVNVQMLDDSCTVFQLEKKAKGYQLLDQVFSHLELSERDYFGLQFCYSSDIVVCYIATLYLKISLAHSFLKYLLFISFLVNFSDGWIPIKHFVSNGIPSKILLKTEIQ